MRTDLSVRREMTIDDVRNKAPSAFATQPYHEVSKHYKFVPTSTVVEKMIDNGFIPVMAAECKTRNGSGKAGFSKHIMRFRHSDLSKSLLTTTKEEVPELVLTNSHDRTSGYTLEAGIFRMVCSNGLIVCSESFEKISIRHMGSENLINDVLEGSFKIIETLPVIMETVEKWKNIHIGKDQQLEYAKSALALSKNSLEFRPEQLLEYRRFDDMGENGSNSLYKTFNVVQENLVRGGLNGKSESGKYRHSKAITAISADTQLNRSLWQLTETFNKTLNIAA